MCRLAFACAALVFGADAFSSLPESEQPTQQEHHLPMTRIRKTSDERKAFKAHLEARRTAGRRRLQGDSVALGGNIARGGEFHLTIM